MNVTCPNCASVFRVDPNKVPDAGVRARCSICSAVFGVRREGDARERTPAAPVGGPTAVPFATPSTPPPASAPMAPMAPRVEPMRPPAPQAPSSAPSTPTAPAIPAAPSALPSPASQPPAAPRPASFPPPAAPLGAPRPAMPAGLGSPAAPAAPAGGLAGARPAAPMPPAPPPAPTPPASAPAAPMAPAPAPAAASPPQASPRAAGTTGSRPVNPFLSQDPALKARRLARALISDMVVYHPAKRQDGLRDGNLKELFEEEIRKSWEEYADQVGKDVADSTPYFKEALNEILAGGRQIF